MQVTAGMHNIRAFKAKKTTKLQHKDEEGAGSLVPAPQTDKLLYRFFLFFFLKKGRGGVTAGNSRRVRGTQTDKEFPVSKKAIQ